MQYPKHQQRHYGRQQDFLTKVREFSTPGAIAALETLDAALVLLAWKTQIPQALVLFHQAIEVALKALLEEIHVLLVLQEINFDLAKGLAKERIQRHRLGGRIANFIDPENYDPQKTCLFEDAYRRVAQLIAFQSVTEKDVRRLNKSRNAITHFGGKPEERLNYLDLILNVALPWLREFYQEAYAAELRDYVFEPNFRELDVAAEYVREAKQNPELPRSQITIPFAHRFFEGYVIGEGNLLFDKNGWMRDVWEWEEDRFQSALHRWDTAWSNFRVIGEKQEVDCVVCGKPCIIAMGEPYELEGARAYDPIAIHCPGCDLHLEPQHKRLAQLHFGPITQERFGEKVWREEINVFGDK